MYFKALIHAVNYLFYEKHKSAVIKWPNNFMKFRKEKKVSKELKLN